MYLNTAKEETNADADGGSVGGGVPEVNALFLRALWMAITVGKVSISALQRRFQIGYSKAGGIIDKMERMQYIAPNEGSGQARRVLITREDFIAKYGEPPAESFN